METDSFFHLGSLKISFKQYLGTKHLRALYLTTLDAGLLRQPKWGHLKDLHRAIKLCEPALVSGDPIVTRLGNYQEVNIFSLSFIFNFHLMNLQNLISKFNIFLGSCIQIKIWCLCCIPCKLQPKILCDRVFR